jgi:RNA polymerase sigma-70 factor (ECF subfamily)
MTGEQGLVGNAADPERQFRADLVAIVPSLRAFARGLCGNRDLADDLAQETLMKAWAARASFTPGTNFRAWMFRILRNHFYTVAGVAKRFVAWDPDLAERVLTTPPTQGGERMVADLQRGLQTLPAEQREALLLMESGLQWDEIAAVMECPLGTVKSRITRGRTALRRYLDGPADPVAPARAVPAEMLAAD